jgi:hypothetical protein
MKKTRREVPNPRLGISSSGICFKDMDFIVGLPKTQTGYDSIWVIVDRLSNVAHFIPIKTTYKGSKLTELYIARIVCLHGVPKKIVSDRGTQFTSKF